MTPTPGAPTPPAGDPLDLSVAIVCRNSIATIGRTLESVRGLAGEIVALDSGSTDGTLELLHHAGAVVHRVQWMGHIRTKQAALEACTRSWVLCLDSDESPDAELCGSIREAVKRNNPEVKGCEVNRKVWWAGRYLNHAWQPEWRLRLVRRGAAAWGGYDPHDSLRLLDGSRGERLRGTLRHDSFQSMDEFLAKQVSHSRLAALSYARLGRKASAWQLVASPVGAWLKQVVIKQAWRDGWRGWCAAASVAIAAAMKHAILMEMQRRGDTPADSPPVSRD